jgi:replicative DNA helicase
MTDEQLIILSSIANMEAEQSVLGAILLEPELIKETKLNEKMFHAKGKAHKILFNAMRAIDREGSVPDLVTIISKLQEKDESLIQKVGGVSYLSDLASSCPTTANFTYYEKLVLDAHKMVMGYRYAVEFMSDIQTARDPILLNKIATQLDELTDAETDDEFDMKKEMIQLYEEYSNPKQGLTGIDTGYGDLNALLDGWQNNDLIIIGARPSVGKTAFVVNTARNASDLDNTWVDFFSLEMSKQQLIKRMVGAEGNIDGAKMRNMSLFTDSDHTKFIHAMGKVSNSNVHIHDQSGMTVEEIRSIARKNNRKAKQAGMKHMVVIDYLQLIAYKGELQSGNLQTGHISKSLKNLARDLQIPVIALSQLSRGVEQRQDKRPMKSDLRDSGQIEQDADVIIMMYREDYYDRESENQNIVEFDIAKQRNGPLGVVQLAFVKEYGKFVNLERRFAS